MISEILTGNFETANVVTTASFTLFTILLAIIGFFGKNEIRQVTFNIKDLAIKVNELTNVMSAEKERISNTKESLNLIKQSIDSKINNITSKVEELDKNLTSIKESIAVLNTLENTRTKSKI
jgi:hypothetical protein